MAKISIETSEVLERANGIFAWACEDDEMKKLTVEQLFSIALVNLSIEKRANEKKKTEYKITGINTDNPFIRPAFEEREKELKKQIEEAIDESFDYLTKIYND